LQPPPLSHSDGAAAEAIRAAESALAHQSSLTAQVDLQVVTAVLNAHTDHAGAVAVLERLQDDIEAAVLIRTDLDTPAGARDFQRYLLEKLRDIRTVVATARRPRRLSARRRHAGGVPAACHCTTSGRRVSGLGRRRPRDWPCPRRGPADAAHRCVARIPDRTAPD
jgi:hypothetical protein